MEGYAFDAQPCVHQFEDTCDDTIHGRSWGSDDCNAQAEIEGIKKFVILIFIDHRPQKSTNSCTVLWLMSCWSNG